MIALNVQESTAQALYTLMLGLDSSSELWIRLSGLFHSMNETEKFDGTQPHPGFYSDPNTWTDIPNFPGTTIEITEGE